MIASKKRVENLERSLDSLTDHVGTLLGCVEGLSATLTLQKKENKKLAKRLDKLIELTRGSIELFDAD